MSCNHNDIYKSKIADVWQCNECGVFFQPVTAVADEKRCFTNDKGTLHAYANKLEWEPKEEQKGCWNCDGKGEVLTHCGICKPPDSPQEKCSCGNPDNENYAYHSKDFCQPFDPCGLPRPEKDYYTKSEIDERMKAILSIFDWGNCLRCEGDLNNHVVGCDFPKAIEDLKSRFL